jgi:aspartyl/asparaginyl-tRNA synthetase
MVKMFAIKRNGFDVSLLVSNTDGTHLELEMEYSELKDLVALSTLTLQEIDKEIFWEVQAENEALNRAEHDAVRQRETALELDFSAKGYDDVPF